MDEKELSELFCNTIQELPLTVEDIKKAAQKEALILKNEEIGMADWETEKRIKCITFNLQASTTIWRWSGNALYTAK